MTKLIDLPDELEYLKDAHGFFEDFNLFVAALDTATEQNGWRIVDTANADSTATGIGVAGGAVDILSSVTTPADNDACLLATDEETFVIAANKPIWFGARVKWTEAATDDANVFIGLSTLLNENTTIADDGAGPTTATAQDTVCFYKVDGLGTGTGVVSAVNNLVCYTQMDDGTATTELGRTELTAANSLDGVVHQGGGGTYQIYEIWIEPRTSTLMNVHFFLTGSDGIRKKVCMHQDISMTSPAAMYPILGVKQGDTNAETITVDYVYCYQTR